jgi:ATP-binding cassette subfamily C (CFTR/MRP) protein 1
MKRAAGNGYPPIIPNLTYTDPIITYSVDATTNELMQQLIRSEFNGRTILAVEHNMANILDYDKVIVLDKGEIIEQGRPEQLLQQESAFRALYETSAH